jgi:NAD(P)-dependent dehydrogenase (short-subunit alcohol dehydrogenase family)
MDLSRFGGKVAIVTGAARGIGAAIAARLASEGAMVVIADLDRTSAEATAGALPGGSDRSFGIACDVASESDVEACAGAAIARFGRIDVIVNNAGLMTFKRLSEWTAADWIKVLEVDLVGAAMFTREAFRRMGENGGAIVNVSSVHAIRTSPQAAPYAAAKAAMLSLTRTTSIEGRARAIRANAVLPGAVDTPMLWDNPNVKSGAENIDPADVGRPEDIAAAVAFLASEDARFITGASLAVDGGRLAKL